MPISPETDYSLMGAVSCLHITPDIYHAAFVSRLDVDSITDRAPRGSFGDTVEHAVLQWRESASFDDRLYMAVHGLQDAPMQLQEATGTVIDSVARAHVRGLGLLPPRFERMIPVPIDDIAVGTPYGEAIDQIFILRGLDRWACKLGDQLRRTIEVMAVITDVEASLATLASRARIHYGSDSPCCVALSPSSSAWSPPPPSRRERQQVRRVINRGIKTFTKFFGGRDLQAFISKGQTIIEGAQFNYWLTNHGNIIAHSARSDGHVIPYGLSICNKQNVPLASACIYVPRTPIIDQILALALNVKDADCEIEFLRTANLRINDTPEATALKELTHWKPPSVINLANFELDICCTPDEAPEVSRECAAYDVALNRTKQELAAMSGRIERLIIEASQISAETFALLTNAQSDGPTITRVWRQERLLTP